MKEEENKDIGHFFSAHLNEGDIPFEEADWKAMEDKLDEFDALALPTSSPRLKWGILASMAALMFLAGWFSHHWIADDPDKSIGEISLRKEDPGGSSTSENIPSQTDRWNDGKISEISGSHEADERTRQKTFPEVGSEGPSTGANEYDRAASQENEKSGAGKNENVHPSGDETTLPERTDRIAPGWTFILPLSEHPIKRVESFYPEASPRIPAFEVGITIAPDLNGVGAAENYKLAWEAGLSLYYNLSQKWRLSTGVYYARKAYLASGSAYSPPEGYWDNTTNGLIPEEVEAHCGILDIPMNVTYIWNPRQKLKFTTTLGLSNYLILNEDYHYEFGYRQPYTGYDSWSTDQNSVALLGLVNAGIGAEWTIRKGLHLAVEPYFKIPLKEIGFGRVPLNGTGVYFTLRKQLTSH